MSEEINLKEAMQEYRPEIDYLQVLQKLLLQNSHGIVEKENKPCSENYLFNGGQKREVLPLN